MNNKDTAVRLLVAAGILLLLGGCIFCFLKQWILVALLGVGAFGCIIAALNFKNHEDK